MTRRQQIAAEHAEIHAHLELTLLREADAPRGLWLEAHRLWCETRRDLADDNPLLIAAATRH
jgi:hypothetical protein